MRRQYGGCGRGGAQKPLPQSWRSRRKTSHLCRWGHYRGGGTCCRATGARRTKPRGAPPPPRHASSGSGTRRPTSGRNSRRRPSDRPVPAQLHQLHLSQSVGLRAHRRCLLPLSSMLVSRCRICHLRPTPTQAVRPTEAGLVSGALATAAVRLHRPWTPPRRRRRSVATAVWSIACWGG